VEVSSLSVREADYLVALYVEGGASRPVKPSVLAEVLGVAKPTATLMLKKLVAQGLVKRVEGGYELTDEGIKLVKEIIWRHGVVEGALLKLGLSKDEACIVARLIELNIPMNSLQCIWRNLGCPVKCPHGLKISMDDKSSPGTCRPLKPCLTKSVNRDKEYKSNKS